MIRNGIDLDQLTQTAQSVTAQPETAPVTFDSRSQWDKQFAVDGHADGIDVEDVELRLSAELDLRGLFQNAAVRPGLPAVEARIRVRSGADDAELAELGRLIAHAPPIFDTIANPVAIRPTVGPIR